VFRRGGWGPHGWVLGPLLPLRSESVSRLLGPEGLERSHDAFHLLVLLRQFLPDLRKGADSVASAPRDRAEQTARVCWEHRGPHLVPFGLECGVSERLAVLVDLLNDALVVHHGGVVVPQQRVLPTLLGVVAYLCQVHAE